LLYSVRNATRTPFLFVPFRMADDQVKRRFLNVSETLLREEKMITEELCCESSFRHFDNLLDKRGEVELRKFDDRIK
jgi:hypothetical protein